MPYDAFATSATPALVIYVLDNSGSMSESAGGEVKTDLVTRMMKKVIREMLRRSTKGSVVSARYRVAIFTYNDDVQDVLGGAITVAQLLEKGIPVMRPGGKTDTAKAFEAVEAMLKSELPGVQNCPAPLVCHMTDGVYTASDPAPVAQRIKQMRTADGNVLIENIFLDDSALPAPVSDPYSWRGISDPSELRSETAKHLFQMSSPLPQTYRDIFRAKTYSIESGARLLFPGTTPEMVEAGFMMSGVTPTV